MAMWRGTLSETRKASDLGYKGTTRYIYSRCPSCGKERWIQCKRVRDWANILCRVCNAKNNLPKGDGRRNTRYHAHWHGGRKKTMGYIQVKLYQENEFFFPMANSNNYVMEHRLVMARHLGRNLQDWEIVHHKNGIKDDNRIENLELSSNLGEHSLNHSKGYRDGYLKGLFDGHTKAIEDLQKRVTLLEAENTLLRSSISTEDRICQ